MSASGDCPVRQMSAHGRPKPTTTIERCCALCGASFLGLAPGRTGERGLWRDWQWFCSAECFPQDRLGVAALSPEATPEGDSE